METDATTFGERLRVPTRWWVQGGLMIFSFWLALIVAIPEQAAWAITATLTALLAIALWSYGNTRTIVKDGWLYAGRASIELKFVGSVSALDPAATRALAGRLANARAFLVMRPYVNRAVRMDIVDPDDPTPYWPVSSRRPLMLKAALERSRQHCVDNTIGDRTIGVRPRGPEEPDSTWGP